MSQIQFEQKWIDQCAAALRVKARFGLDNALDYLIGAKLLNFAETAKRYTEFMQELPDFLQEIRVVFSMEETREYAGQLQQTRPLSPFQREVLGDFLSFGARPLTRSPETSDYHPVRPCFSRSESGVAAHLDLC
jgi:hypothetical protein